MKFNLIFLLLIGANSVLAQKADMAILPNLPFAKHELKTEKDTITFYLSTTASKESLPLIIYVQGSGMNSLFAERNGKVVPTLGHSAWYKAGQDQYRILIVEKPGVKYLQTGESKSFDQKFSLETWSRTIMEAIQYVMDHENIDRRKTLIAGHSEGGVVAARVANQLQDKISHVAVMAGEGPSQLYSLYKFADDGTFFNTKEHNMPTSEQRLKYLTDMWVDILADPNSTEKKFWGFTYLRWSSLLKTSVIEELTGYNGKIMLLQGLADKAVYPETATIAYTTLLTKGKNVKLLLVENADHSFYISDKPDTDGWRMAIDQIIQWFNEP